MKAELKQKLVAEFPTMFAETHPANMCSCSDGWFELIHGLCHDLVQICPGLEVHQIKEKFGGLRFHIGPVPCHLADAICIRIDEAEKASFMTCEWCGKIGEATTEGSAGWIRTLCRGCRLKEKEGRFPWLEEGL